MDAWPNVIGDEVELRIEAEAVRGAGPEEKQAPDPAVPAPVEGATPP